MRTRFRKSFPLIGNLLQWTISRRGVSPNARLGPLSRSWGTRGNNTTIDAPGAFGLSWRQESRRSRRRNAELGSEERELVNLQRAAAFWRRFAILVILLVAVVEALHLYLGRGVWAGVSIPASAWLTLLSLVAVQVVLVYVLQSIRVPNFAVFVLSCLGVYIQWKLFGGLVLDGLPPAHNPAEPSLAANPLTD